jgi:hypothetical protein
MVSTKLLLLEQCFTSKRVHTCDCKGIQLLTTGYNSCVHYLHYTEVLASPPCL